MTCVFRDLIRRENTLHDRRSDVKSREVAVIIRARNDRMSKLETALEGPSPP